MYIVTDMSPVSFVTIAVLVESVQFSYGVTDEMPRLSVTITGAVTGAVTVLRNLAGDTCIRLVARNQLIYSAL